MFAHGQLTPHDVAASDQIFFFFFSFGVWVSIYLPLLRLHGNIYKVKKKNVSLITLKALPGLWKDV